MTKMQILAKNPPPNPLVLREGESCGRDLGWGIKSARERESKELPRTREE